MPGAATTATELGKRIVTSRYLLLVVSSTVLVTASFIGVLALIAGDATGVGRRLPYYFLVMAVVFTATLLVLERRRTEGIRILVTTTGIAVFAFLVAGLSGEGVVYAVEHPDRVFESSLVVYLVAAGIICTGLGYWGVRHWREFARTR